MYVINITLIPEIHSSDGILGSSCDFGNNNMGGANYDDPLPILKPEGILCFSAMIL